MGRYRPPTPAGAKYITREGWRRLSAELDQLWRIERPEVTRAVSEAAAQGDRSENAEYIYGKKRLREIDGRVRFLQKRLEVLQVVERAPGDRSLIFFGAWVRLRKQNGEIKEYRIVGPDEFDREPAYISVDAPLARALLKKAVGDEIRLTLPASEVVFVVEAIRYEADAAH